jgi:hypothetical protein
MRKKKRKETQPGAMQMAILREQEKKNPTHPRMGIYKCRIATALGFFFSIFLVSMTTVKQPTVNVIERSYTQRSTLFKKSRDEDQPVRGGKTFFGDFIDRKDFSFFQTFFFFSFFFLLSQSTSINEGAIDSGCAVQDRRNPSEFTAWTNGGIQEPQQCSRTAHLGFFFLFLNCADFFFDFQEKPIECSRLNVYTHK